MYNLRKPQSSQNSTPHKTARNIGKMHFHACRTSVRYRIHALGIGFSSIRIANRCAAAAATHNREKETASWQIKRRTKVAFAAATDFSIKRAGNREEKKKTRAESELYFLSLSLRTWCTFVPGSRLIVRMHISVDAPCERRFIVEKLFFVVSFSSSICCGSRLLCVLCERIPFDALSLSL